MGCATSKFDELPAVALCHDRCTFLDEAIRQRFALAEAHGAYLRSLKAVGLSLDRFFYLDFDAATRGPASPVVNLPPPGKGKEPPGSPPNKTQHHLHSRSDSGSHLEFNSDSEDDDGFSSEFHHHDEADQQQRPYEAGGRLMNISYMEKPTTPSVLHTHRPMSPETMNVGQSSASSSSYYPHPNYAENPYNNMHYNRFENYSSALAAASSSKAPPPPPSPPRSSAWDFLYPFGTFEDTFSAYTLGQNSLRTVREVEGIPDLEDEDDEVVKAIGRGLVNSKKGGISKPLDDGDEGWKANEKDFKNVIFKNAIDAEDNLKVRSNMNGVMDLGVFKGDLEVLKEIRVQFERASESGSELAKFLEVGKLPYKWKRKSHPVSFKKVNLPAISIQHLMSKSSGNGDPALLDVSHDVDLRSKNLSSTLHKLYLWETKLYQEVKVEEKMRVLHDRKSRKTKRMDESGVESHKVEAAKTLVRSLSTNIEMAIQVVDKISVTVNTLRDEELWPQITNFIQGLSRMWKSMLECHLDQSRAIGKAKQLDAIALSKNSTDTSFEATWQLEHDLIRWMIEFSNWVEAQKGFVLSLNNWLTKCLLYIPEETPDGQVPFSPARIGAPRIFIVSHHWSKMLEKISEKEVVDSMHDLASDILNTCQDKADKDKGIIKRVEKEDREIQKEIQSLRFFALEKNAVGPRERVVYPSETTHREGSLRASLQNVVEAMGVFCGGSLRVYEEILGLMEEMNLDDEHPEVS